MSIYIRTVANDGLVGVAPQLATQLYRYMGGKHVLDSATVPAGKDQLGRPGRTAVHLREDRKLFAALEAVYGLSANAAVKDTARSTRPPLERAAGTH